MILRALCGLLILTQAFTLSVLYRHVEAANLLLQANEDLRAADKQLKAAAVELRAQAGRLANADVQLKAACSEMESRANELLLKLTGARTGTWPVASSAGIPTFKDSSGRIVRLDRGSSKTVK